MKPAKHGRDHLPGGEDPIPSVAAAGPVSAIADSGGLHSVTFPGGANPIRMNGLWATGGSTYFAPEGGSAASFDYIMLLQDGFYQADFSAYFGSAFGSFDFPFIRPSCVISGADDTLVNSLVEPYWDNTQGWIAGEQFNDAGELAHRQLIATVWFNYEAALIDPDFGIGVSLDSSFAGTKSVGGTVAVTRLGDPLEAL